MPKKDDFECENCCYGIVVIPIIFIFMLVILYSEIVLPVVGCVLIAICAIIIIKKRDWESKTKKVLTIGVLIQIGGLIFCLIWLYIATLIGIVDIWVSNHTGLTAVDYFFQAILGINLGVGFINLLVIVVLFREKGTGKKEKKGKWKTRMVEYLKPKRKDWEIRMVEYNDMCVEMTKDLDLNKSTFTEEEYKEWNPEQHKPYYTEEWKEWEAKQPKPEPKPEPIKLTCRNCGEELLHYNHCDLCGWSKDQLKEFKTPEKEEEKQSRRIPQRIKNEVWRRDKGKCAECGSRLRLEYDHIIPFSKGGSNTARNIELLCENCNRKKSNKI